MLENLTPLFQENIPTFKEPPIDLFKISGFPHYENVISNWYAFFFNSDAEHGLEDLFISSLTSLIKAKTKVDFEFNGCFADREVNTEKGGRLDILLQDKAFDRKILIENKMYHTLENDLQDYYQSFQGDRIGVLLTIDPVDPKHENFVNITHKELLTEVSGNLGAYWMKAPEKHLLLLKEFIANINSFYKSDDMKESIDFFLKNLDKISDVVKLNNEVMKHVSDEIEAAGKALGYETGARKTDFYRYWIFKETPHCYYTIIFENLLNGSPQILLVLEFYKISDSILQKVKKLNFDKNANYQHLDFNLESNRRQTWMHFASKTYSLTTENLNNLNQFLVESVQKDFDSLKKELLPLFKNLS